MVFWYQLAQLYFTPVFRPSVIKHIQQKRPAISLRSLTH